MLQYTANLVIENGRIPYIMRPEFLLNYLTLAPKTGDTDALVQQLLPSHVGLQIGQHLPAAHMHRILQEIEHWNSLPPERVEIKITDAVNNLKFDRMKRYETNLDAMGDMDVDKIIAALKTESK